MNGADWIDHWCDSDENWYTEEENWDDWEPIRKITKNQEAAMIFRLAIEEENERKNRGSFNI